MTMNSKKRTAAELMAELQRDPIFRARQDDQEQMLRERELLLHQLELPLLQALSEVGVKVESVWNLANSPIPYSQALPILIDHFQHPYPDEVREGIARAMAVSGARPHWNWLIRVYREESSRRVKDGLAVAIAAAATDDVIGDVIALTREKSHGASRLLLLSALERSQITQARHTLIELSDDPDLQEEVRLILRRKKRSTR